MNFYYDYSKRIPLPRKPIHSLNPSPQRVSKDVVDNVMSTMRQASLDDQQQIVHEEFIGLHWPSREDLNVDPQIEEEGSIAGLEGSTEELQELNESFSEDDSDVTLESLERHKKYSNNKTYFSSLAAIVLFISYFAIDNKICWFKAGPQSVFNEDYFNRQIDSLGCTHSVDSDSLLQLQSGISVVSNSNSAGSFVFLYDSREMGFSYISFTDFVESIAGNAARYLRQNATVKPLVLRSESLGSLASHNEFLHQYKEQMTWSAVMLVRELHALPSRLAMAFHYFCDEYDPFVERSSVFFTLDLASCGAKLEKGSKVLEYLDRCLRRKWRDIHQDMISPLLTRVLSVVIDLSDNQFIGPSCN